MQPEKREQPRRSVQTLVELSSKGVHSCSGISTDVSKGGMSVLLANVPLQPGTVCEVKFDLLVKGKVLGVKALAEVRNAGKAEYQGYHSGCRVGLRFVSIETLASWTVEAFVGQAAKEAPPVIWSAPHLAGYRPISDDE
jgi:c-di-GMP-binding flagellar brake protein YcgR